MPTTPPELTSHSRFFRDNRRFFFFWSLAALALRVIFLFKFKLLTDDSFIYGDIAKNWLLHHVYGLSTAHGPQATYIRLPGYPMFLAVLWRIVGIEHYRAVFIAQIVVDIATCFLIADLARRIVSSRAGKAAFILAALCPFLATYAVVGLTETLAIFFAALALDAVVAAFDHPFRKTPWVVCGLGLAGGILLRPDGGMLLIVIGAYGLFHLFRGRLRRPLAGKEHRETFVGLLVVALIALAPLVPWTIRNWRTMHYFEPLTPLYANMPDEFVPHGFHRWVRTWIIDYSSVEDVWFNVDGQSVDVDDIPRRAFDNPQQLQRTVEIFGQYDDEDNSITPAIDAQFAQLAKERIRAYPLRFYVELPFLRGADLWLRPRTEMLPIDAHWWRYWQDPGDFAKALGLALIDLFYLIAAAIALVKRRVRHAGLFVLFALVRTAFLVWMPNPEPRYVLECFPAVIAMAGGLFSQSVSKPS